MAFKKKAKKRPKLADDPKVQEAAAYAATFAENKRLAERQSEAAKTDAVVARVQAHHQKRSGPSKTQVCDAVREGQPGLAFAAVDRIATAVMRLYGRE
jgi:hypothetical protein